MKIRLLPRKLSVLIKKEELITNVERVSNTNNKSIVVKIVDKIHQPSTNSKYNNNIFSNKAIEVDATIEEVLTLSKEVLGERILMD